MTEYDGATYDLTLAPGEYADHRIGDEFTGAGEIPPLYSTDTREIDPDAAVTYPDLIGGEYAGWTPRDGGEMRPGLEYRVPTAIPAGRRIGPAYTGRAETFFEGMFNARDKLARIGVVCTLTGVPLGNTDVILNGINHREIVQTDHRGVWWKYLEIDEYPGALFISPNGITYDLLRQAERVDNEGIFDQIVQRRTLANATSRQLHRKFV